MAVSGNISTAIFLKLNIFSAKLIALNITDFHLVDKFEEPVNTIQPVGKGNAVILTTGVQEEIQAVLRYYSKLKSIISIFNIARDEVCIEAIWFENVS